ncbi:MAG: TrkA family potassium uptake protein [Clostridia bacterium]|jgi:trk system potassium uptake protein TrkA|nr:TrkA family potassium uptake protein [Clostridia bacterium]
MKSVLLIGLGVFGSQVAEELNKLGHEIMGVDIEEKKVNDALPIVTDAQIGDSTSVAFLKELDVPSYDVCIVAIGNNFQSSLETACNLKDLGAKLVVARADREVQAKFLLRNGADRVVNPEKQVAKWTAVRFTSDHILDYFQLDDDHAIYEVDIPSDWIGKTVGGIDIRRKYGINIIAVRQNGKLLFAVTPDTRLDSGNSMLVFGESHDLKKCFKIQ